MGEWKVAPESSARQQEPSAPHGHKPAPRFAPPSPEKLKTQRDKILSALENAGSEGCSSEDLYSLGVRRVGSRLFDLRAEGYDIRTECHGAGRFFYFLVSVPESGATSQASTRKSTDDLASIKFQERHQREGAEAMPLFAGVLGGGA